MFPFTREGRQTLVYITLAGCGPALTACIMWALSVIEKFPGASAEQRLDRYVELAYPLTWGLLLIVLALACFVSIRAVKLEAGKDGVKLDASGDGDGE